MKTKFYHFRQNNSGGQFHFKKDRGITVNVIVEAVDAGHANSRATSTGLYFNGVHDGSDCSCCGDRWDRVNEEDARDFPHIYGTLVENHKDYKSGDYDHVAIHRLDGTVEWFKGY